MMGAPVGRKDRLFYEFCLDDLVPANHLLRKIDAVLDLSWLREELKSHYSQIGRPSVCPELMIRMLLVGYCYTCALMQSEAYAVSSGERKKIERLFGEVKHILGLTRLRLRGLTGAQDEFLLAATVQNLKRLVRHAGIPPPARLAAA